MPDFSHTIAIARDLLASGRSHQVMELLGSVSMPDDARSDNEAALLRALAARAVLMEHGDARQALRWLRPYLDLELRSALSDRARCEVSVWLAWALAEKPDCDDAELPLCLFAEAIGFARPDQVPDVRLWSTIGRTRLLDSLGQPRLSAHYGNSAQAYLAQNPDPMAARWLGTPEPDGGTGGAATASAASPDNTWSGTKPLLDVLELYLDSGYPVVLAGETGSGREYTARSLHQRKGGHARRFHVLGSRDLLTGTERWTDPSKCQESGSGAGRPADATVLLKDLDSAPVDVLDEIPTYIREMTSGGCRVIVSTAPLRGTALTATLPEELYTLLQAFVFEIPPLRERRDELPSIVRSVARSLTEDGGSLLAFTDAAVEVLATYDWPGNVDELTAVIERLQWPAAVDPLRVVDADALNVLDVHPRNGKDRELAHSLSASGDDLSAILEGVERDVIVQALGRAGGHVTAAARALGLSRQGLYKKMKRLDIDPHRSARTHSS